MSDKIIEITGMNASLLTDFYKFWHRLEYPDKTTSVYSTWTPRMSRIDHIDEVIAFGYQAFIQEYLINYFNVNFFLLPREQVLAEYARICKNCLAVEDPDVEHIGRLHDLGYLPVEIKAVPEGTRVPLRCPMFTIENTIPEFFWVTNYLETLISLNLWKPSTVATIADSYKKLLTEYAEFSGNPDAVGFQGHDFSMRGAHSIEDAARTSAAHLTAFTGTDTVPGILFLESFYGANIELELVGGSVYATEHSVMCAGGKDTELETFRRLIDDVHPTGILSIVSDAWDFFKVVTEVLPALKDTIMARDGKVVIRPDSGDPADILCGTSVVIDCNRFDDLDDAVDEVLDYVDALIKLGQQEVSGLFEFDNLLYRVIADVEWAIHKEDDKPYVTGLTVTSCEKAVRTPEEKGLVELLYEIFGGTVNDADFIELDPHIGAIYGDAITYARCEDICERLIMKGFASTNVVFGIGSYTYHFNTRDTFGFALKSTDVVIDDEEIAIFKNPKTDDGVKKSQRGRVAVVEIDGDITWIEDIKSGDVIESDMLQTVFKDGEVFNITTLAEIRERLCL